MCSLGQLHQEINLHFNFHRCTAEDPRPPDSWRHRSPGAALPVVRVCAWALDATTFLYESQFLPPEVPGMRRPRVLSLAARYPPHRRFVAGPPRRPRPVTWVADLDPGRCVGCQNPNTTAPGWYGFATWKRFFFCGLRAPKLEELTNGLWLSSAARLVTPPIFSLGRTPSLLASPCSRRPAPGPRIMGLTPVCTVTTAPAAESSFFCPVFLARRRKRAAATPKRLGWQKTREALWVFFGRPRFIKSAVNRGPTR